MILILGQAGATGVGAAGRLFFKGKQRTGDVQAQVRPEEAAEAHGIYLVPGRSTPLRRHRRALQLDGFSVVLAHLSPVLRKELGKEYEKLSWSREPGMQGGMGKGACSLVLALCRGCLGQGLCALSLRFLICQSGCDGSIYFLPGSL